MAFDFKKYKSAVTGTPFNQNDKDFDVKNFGKSHGAQIIPYEEPYAKHLNTVKNYFKKSNKEIPTMNDINAAISYHKNARGGLGIHKIEFGQFFDLMNQSMTEKDVTDPYYLRAKDKYDENRPNERERRMIKRNIPKNKDN